ncbi:Sec-independent protein translocase protein TatB [Sphingosinicella sp. CPCC 101087]|uniref:Sec-independent protein translocase protein TatB n=1 Tax=Sphingosinicella sp. CPCC 101087 TaxID=2497754 RepID=UPI00101D6C09|nr:Sec-independent protein translocase protein TatB [Sphingosinicella sp. CPCC 101087]
MFGIDSGELLIIAVIALVVIGPKDLPRAMRTIGNFVGRARGMARHFRSGFDAMMREAELEEMEKKWRADNERIMREHPQMPAAESGDSGWGKPAPETYGPTQPVPPTPPGPEALSGGASPTPPGARPTPPPEERP